jgi:2-C-methyl-D-erythritol 4-phosphate cytidylyltransferase
LAEERKGHWAIVVSAGTGSRMGGNVSKGLLKLDDIPLVAFSLKIFQMHRSIDAICLVAHQRWLHEYVKVAEAHRIDKLECSVPGGPSRQESVYKGLEEISPFARRVLIHDGARPFIEEQDISNLLEALKEFSGASLGYPITDTVKRCDDKDVVREEISRIGLMGIQTPQAFRFRDIMNAHIMAQKKGWRATDDTSLLTRMGTPVKIIESKPENIKVTRPGDMYTAELILRKLRKAGTVKL